MDFKLTKTQMLQQELFRKFAETEIKPIAKDKITIENCFRNCRKSVLLVFLTAENTAARVQTF